MNVMFAWFCCGVTSCTVSDKHHSTTCRCSPVFSLGRSFQGSYRRWDLPVTLQM